jgi:multidrug efflux system outer membrane protein
MNRAILTAFLACSTMLAGCNLAPNYVRPVGAVPAEFPHDGIYPAAASDPPDVSTIGWHDFFTDPRLRQVIGSGLENNRDLRVAAANVMAAQAQYRVQRSRQFPTVSTNNAATFTNDPTLTRGGTGEHIYSVDLGINSFEVDLFGRLKNLSKAALEQYFASDEGQRATRISLISEIATQWLTLASDLDQLEISKKTMESFAKSRELTEAQFRIGTQSELNARQADAQYQAARNDVAVLETQIAQDRNALELLVGGPIPAALLPATLPEDATLSQLPAGISSEVLLRRPDVLQAEHRLIAQNADIGAARAALFPTISLTGILGAISSPLGGLFSGSSFYRTLEPSASYNIFDAGRARANVRVAEADKQAAVATYEKTIQTAFREVADALAERGTIDEQLSAQRSGAESAEVAARLSFAQYEVGVGSFLNYLDSQRTAYSSQQALVTTRLNRATNLVRLYSSLGGGLS